jgi:predicted enzyme related to lactoylglutathione lyase
MARVIHFDFTAEDLQRAISFYEKAFGWKFKKWEGPMDYWLVTTGPEGEPGIDGGLSKRENGAGFTNTIGVSSVDEAAKKVIDAGGKVIRPKVAIPGAGYFALCEDTEGNQFGLMEDNPEAR